MESLSHVTAIVVAIIGATWALRSKLGDIETKLEVHIGATSAELAALAAKVIKLEERRFARRVRK